jgi:chromosome partition protein MukE
MSEEAAGRTFGYRSIGDVIRDERFAEIDVALRKGRHVGVEDVEHFAFLEEARPLLDEFYGAYDWDLAADDAGFFYLLPRGELGGAELSANAMLVGQACLLLKLDPQTVRSHDRVTRSQLLELLGAVVGEEELARRLTGAKDRRETRRIELVHQKLGGALKELHRLGFVQVSRDEVVLRSALVRFAEPVRGDGDWRSRLPDLVRRGYVVVEGEEPEGALVDEPTETFDQDDDEPLVTVDFDELQEDDDSIEDDLDGKETTR